MKRIRAASHRAGIFGLMVLLAVALAVEGIQPAHSHEDGRLGLYNAECPLAELTAVHADGWAPSPVAITSPAQSVLPAARTSSGWVPSPSRNLSESRAPPLA